MLCRSRQKAIDATGDSSCRLTEIRHQPWPRHHVVLLPAAVPVPPRPALRACACWPASPLVHLAKPSRSGYSSSTSAHEYSYRAVLRTVSALHVRTSMTTVYRSYIASAGSTVPATLALYSSARLVALDPMWGAESTARRACEHHTKHHHSVSPWPTSEHHAARGEKKGKKSLSRSQLGTTSAQLCQPTAALAYSVRLTRSEET